MKKNNISLSKSKYTLPLVLIASLSATNALAENLPTKEVMWQMILKQQEQIKRLESIIGITKQKVSETNIKIEQNEAKIEATADAMDNIMATSDSSGTNGTSLGGYAELHYNGGKSDKIDLHRFVVFLSHEFSERIRFFSEFEIEHSISGEGQVGEVEVEQAYIEMDINDNHRVSFGVQLIPVGILNEIHEPPTFYGVERNNVEKNIIPSTWWEAGIKMSGNLSESLSYDLMLHSGLDTTGSAYKIRSGRKKVGKAPWKNTAFTARANWLPLPGVTLGATFQYQDDITQSGGIDESASATLLVIHTDISRSVRGNGTFGFRALYAQWNVNAETAEILGRDLQRGWYIEPSYKINLDDDNAVGFFARYSIWDNEAGDTIDSTSKQTSFGINYWPHENVVLKLDYQIDNFTNSSSEDNRINLGVGLQF